MLEWIRTRRSIRRYLDRPVSPEHREILAEAALRAPSSHDHRPCDVVYVTDRETIARLAVLKPSGAAFLAGAPLAAVVLADPTRSDVWVEDASIVATLLHLTAHSLGLGSCWVQVHGREREPGRTASEYVRELIGAPEGREVLAVIGIGHPAAEKPPVPAEALPREQVHRERFGGT
jgi:nitroreductase